MSPTPSDARCARCGHVRSAHVAIPTTEHLAACIAPMCTCLAFVAPTRVDEALEGEPTKRNVPAQEEVVCALWDFASALGIPKNMDTTRPIMAACGPALQRIMAAFNCRVTEIQ